MRHSMRLTYEMVERTAEEINALIDAESDVANWIDFDRAGERGVWSRGYCITVSGRRIFVDSLEQADNLMLVLLWMFKDGVMAGKNNMKGDNNGKL